VKLPDIKPAKITIDHRSSRGLRIAAICALTAIFVGFLTFSAPRRLPQWVSAIQSVAETAPARIADASIRARNPEPPPAPLKPSPEPATPIAVPAPPPKVAATEGSAAARDTNRPAAAAAVVKPALPAPKPADVPPAPGDSPRTVPVEVLSGVTTRPAAEEPLKIVLSVTSPSWVIATADGKGTVSRLLDVGDEEVVDARKEVVLTAGDGAALVMTINGAPARSLGEARETIKVRITRANFKDFLAP
jgi:hypothetical protein